MNILQTERAAETTSQAARFARAIEHIQATNGREIIIEAEDSFRVTVWSDQGRQLLFSAQAKTVDTACRKASLFLYGVRV